MASWTVAVGTRGSSLALAQANWVIELLKLAHPEVTFQVRPITTRGDRDHSVELSGLGESGVFTRELERALADWEIDMAVHSYKDLPTAGHERLTVSAVPKRADPFDVLVLREAGSLRKLRTGSHVGAGSPRRREALRCVRPDLKLVPIRGNIDTRLEKLEMGEYDAIVMAGAALARLGLTEKTETLERVMLPAPAQGALAVQTRTREVKMVELARTIHDTQTGLETATERRVLSGLGGGCHLPLGVLGRVVGEKFNLRAAVYANGRVAEFRTSGRTDEGDKLADELVRQIRERFPKGLPGETASGTGSERGIR